MIDIELLKQRSEKTVDMSTDDFSNLIESFEVDESNLTKPVRIYLDVDGVILPFIKDEEDLKKFDTVVEAKTLQSDWNGVITETTIYYPYISEIVERVSRLSHHPSVDLVFLTSWQFNAARSLAKSFNIKTAGYLPWQQKISDYSQSFKGVAIRELEEKKSSKFIWIDDLANRKDTYSSHYFSLYQDLDFDETTNSLVEVSFEDYRKRNQSRFEEIESIYQIQRDSYLTISPNSYSGLTVSELDEVEKWVERALRK